MPPATKILKIRALDINLLKTTIYQKEDIHILFALIVSAVFLIWIYPISLDVKLSNLYFDEASNRFILKHQYFLDNIMHDALKNCMRVIALGSLGIALLLTLKQRSSKPVLGKSLITNPYFFVFVGMFAANSTVGFLKHISVHGCPNDLLMYGGKLPLLHLFADLPVGIDAGHCFPGGHASGGFALASFYFAFRESKPRFAGSMLTLSLVIGFAMGWVQVMRGEHFLSHNLWSAWVVWLVLLVLHTVKSLTETNQHVFQQSATEAHHAN